MEKRLVAFMLSSMLVLMGYFLLVQTMTPRPEPAGVDLVRGDDAEGDAPPKQRDKSQPVDELSLADPDADAAPDTPSDQENQEDSAEASVTEAAKSEEQVIQQRWISLGSADPTSGYRMLVYLNSQGAAIERATLSSPKFLDLDVKRGHFGALLVDDQGGNPGCRIRSVGHGTPASLAGLMGQRVELGPEGNPVNLPGDLITRVGEQSLSTTTEFEALLAQHKPGEVLGITVQRKEIDGTTSNQIYDVKLGRKPLDVLDRRRLGSSDAPPSYLFSLVQVGQAKADFGKAELNQLPSLRESNWVTETFEDEVGEGVEFRLRISDADMKKIGAAGPLEIIKRVSIKQSSSGLAGRSIFVRISSLAGLGGQQPVL